MSEVFSVAMMRDVEAQALQSKGKSAARAGARVVGLFLLVALGYIASWFYDKGTTYLADTSKGLQLGTWLEFLVRVVLGLIVAGLIFVPVYNKVRKGTEETWIMYFL